MSINTTDSVEVLIDPDQYARIQRLILTYAGITLGPNKHQMVQNRLAKDMREMGVISIGQFLDRVESEPVYLQRFVNSLTTNVTSFYREAHHHVNWIAHVERLATLPMTPHKVIQVWSSGCSTGEEPISLLLALIGAGYERLIRNQQIHIFASDINDVVIRQARFGVYEERLLAPIPKSLRALAFEPIGKGQYRVKEALLKCISYDTLNLSAERWRFPVKSIGQRFDAIFCRNVMIYFSAAQQRIVLERMHGYLAPKGLLFTGHSEMLLSAEKMFETVGHTVFRKSQEKYDHKEENQLS
jgi:chemotaxis protein methyltransferase CheR